MLMINVFGRMGVDIVPRWRVMHYVHKKPRVQY